jgi:hypothetical protein
MIKPLLLAAAGLSLTSCAAPRPEPVRHVFISGPGEHHVIHRSARGPNRVVVLRGRDGKGPLILNGSSWNGAELTPEQRANIDRITRDARALGEEARRVGALAQLQGEAARRRGEEARLRGEAARLRGEAARARGEAARARGEAMRVEADRLRGQCERGEIECQITESDGTRTIIITR